nr:polysaccharide deacetylase family protein [Oceanobacter mangrovi]
MDRGLWPTAIVNKQEFNRASAAEILVFSQLLDQIDIDSEANIQGFTGIENINAEEVYRWRDRTRQQLLRNYQLACADCGVTDWQSLVSQPLSQTQADNTAWLTASQKFHQYYLYEQVRLAALFPRITSEISLLDPDKEINGTEFPDLHFLLTYDDGPAADATRDGKVVNPTAMLVESLNRFGLHGQFFVLGERLVSQKPAINTYDGQCLGSHGQQHKSHQKWQQWAESLDATTQALVPYQSGPYWLRPPYGQRHQELLDHVAAEGGKVMLWNIDSQDWNKKLTNDEVRDRVKTLMLLWRHGIILYHDVHPRALDNLAALNQFAQQTGLTFVDCHQLTIQP